MKILHMEDIKNIKENVACIGYFDGVHLGHQKLIETTKQIAKIKELDSNVITFYPDPEKVIHKNNVRELTSLDERLSLFEKMGIDNVLLLDFDEELMKKDAEDFVWDYIINAKVNTLVCGFDFHYGYKASGDTEILKKYKEFETCVVEEIQYEKEKISSTRIRKLLDEGKTAEARKLLGHD